MYSVYHNIKFPQSYIAFQGDEECGDGDYMQQFLVPTIGREIFENVGYMISNWGADALFVYRCAVIYQGCSMPLWKIAILLAISLLLGSVGTGVIFLISSSQNQPYNIFLYIHWITTFTLNAMVTTMIVLCLAIHRRQVSRALGKEYGSVYTGIISMVIESQFLIVVLDIALVIGIFVNELQVDTLYQVVSQVQILAPLLITFRVAHGKAWSERTHEVLMSAVAGHGGRQAISTLRFGTNSTVTRVTDSSMQNIITQAQEIKHNTNLR
ncbi:hypothetical protein BDQ17DRAFT_1430807 [Cyathus striatus]|nr:hypothetical protein BDQ17DRAFT_1430807 [Cyathus striatus]